ncbi:hypothetical protein Agub_g10330 [Astrephomene gubernaculifera]|uniref:Uncharacterized protein n=1 Tax=Astrephomene gubernaculifera TaxID=47775 RepID=A0AAD3DX95_9CHLO|nr:hypothetical protein Agub_g10330 [Astrephomene gubernaculifera]
MAVTYDSVRQLQTHIGEAEFSRAVKTLDELDVPEVYTPAAEVKTIEALLGVTPGAFDGYAFRMKASKNSGCKGCGRQMNWLDVCHTALKVPGHTPEFIMETFEGAHGLVLAPPFRMLTCHSCNTVQDCKRERIVRGYNCKGYVCMGG